MENYIKINGQTLTEAQSKMMVKIAEALGYIAPETTAATEPKKSDPYARRIGGTYWFINYRGEVFEENDVESELDEDKYNVGNYYPDEFSARQQAMHETLDRLLRRYSEQHGGDPDWNGTNHHWCIYLDAETKAWQTDYWRTDKLGCPSFCSQAVADDAIRDVVEPFCAAHPEFVW